MITGSYIFNFTVYPKLHFLINAQRLNTQQTAKGLIINISDTYSTIPELDQHLNRNRPKTVILRANKTETAEGNRKKYYEEGDMTENKNRYSGYGGYSTPNL
jgi:hypothetical protein